MMWNSISGKGQGRITSITSTVNAKVYTEILDTFLIPWMEKSFLGMIMHHDSIIFARGYISHIHRSHIHISKHSTTQHMHPKSQYAWCMRGFIICRFLCTAYRPLSTSESSMSEPAENKSSHSFILFLFFFPFSFCFLHQSLIDLAV